MTDPDFDMDLVSGIAAFEAKEFSRAAQILGPMADSGNADAQFRLAIMCQNGLGRVASEADAFKWMQAAAEQGMPLAEHGLGFMYLEGECAAKDPAKAVLWFSKAAAQGMVGSAATLGTMYKDGNGVEQDTTEASKWFELAGFDPDEF